MDADLVTAPVVSRNRGRWLRWVPPLSASVTVIPSCEVMGAEPEGQILRAASVKPLLLLGLGTLALAACGGGAQSASHHSSSQGATHESAGGTTTTTTVPASTTSTSPAGSNLPTTASPVGTTMQVNDGSGEVYSVSLVQVVDPLGPNVNSDGFTLTTPTGRDVGLLFTVTNTGTEPISISGGNGQYPEADTQGSTTGPQNLFIQPQFGVVAGCSSYFALTGSFLAPGQSMTGCFVVPVAWGNTVSLVDWSDPARSGESVAEWS